MSKAVFGGVMMAALAVALAFRLTGLDLRPMHHDEANQAVKFGLLLEDGDYRYDRNDHHGPTLYYLTLPSAWIRGQTTLASLDERTLRVVPALFGAGVLLLLPLMAGGLGRTAVAASALLAAISPAMTYYSRFFIQESLLVFFTLAFLIAVGRWVQQRRAGWAVAAGVFAGLAFATKETSVITLSAAAVAAVVARVWTPQAAGSGARAPASPAQAAPDGHGRTAGAVHAAWGLASALGVAFVLYSSFFRYPSAPIESIRAFGIYVERGMGAGPHVQPWQYYLSLLAFSRSGGLVWTEGLVLLLALAGAIVAVRKTTGFWSRYIALYSLITALAFSLVAYKTPWNLLPFHAGFVVMAGVGMAALLDSLRSRAWRGLVAVALLAASWHLGVQDWRANFRYPADPRNPYVYAHTTPDFLRLVRRIDDVAAIHPERTRMFVEVIAGPYEQWPLPWYLRGMSRVGYWTRAADAGRPEGAPVIVASQENTAALDAALDGRYVSEFYGLRPDVLLTVYIERPLWERVLATR